MLTFKQNKFVQFYDGNATQAAIKAGYSKKTANEQGARLLAHVSIKQLIKNRQDKKINAGIATREDRQKFWTKMMKHKSGLVSLRASELLGKSECDFIEKVEHSGKVDGGITVITSSKTVKV